MKKIVFSVVVALLACVSINAQNVMNAVSEETILATETPVEETIVEDVNEEPLDNQEAAERLSLPTLQYQSMTADNSTNYMSDPAWRRAKNLRTAGIIMTSAGGGIALIGGINALQGINSDNLAGIFLGGAAATLAVGGAVVAVAGGIMWIVGNKKMRNIRLASNGIGLAYTF